MCSALFSLPSKDYCLESVYFGLSFPATARLADLLGVPGAPNTQANLSTAENSAISSETIAGMKDPMCVEVDHDFVPRHNSKRPRTKDQVLDTRKRQITERNLWKLVCVECPVIHVHVHIIGLKVFLVRQIHRLI